MIDKAIAAAETSSKEGRQPSGEAQAAILLVESLMHSLLENGALTKTEALEMIDSAYTVKEESLARQNRGSHAAQHPLNILSGMRNSISAHDG